MDSDKKRLYNALNVGLFIFIEDEFLFNEKEDETKAQVLIDFARMDTEDRNALLDSIPEGTLGKKELQDYADKADSWIFEINWSNVPLDDAERILDGRPDILALYQAVPENLWEGEYQQFFLRYGIQWLMEQLRLSRQKRFGSSSERTSEEAMEQLSLLFNEAEVYADQGAKEEDNSVAAAAHKRGTRNMNTRWTNCLKMCR